MDPYGQLAQYVHETAYARRNAHVLPQQAHAAELLRERDLLSAETAGQPQTSHRPALRRFGAALIALRGLR